MFWLGSIITTALYERYQPRRKYRPRPFHKGHSLGWRETPGANAGSRSPDSRGHRTYSRSRQIYDHRCDKSRGIFPYRRCSPRFPSSKVFNIETVEHYAFAWRQRQETETQKRHSRWWLSLWFLLHVEGLNGYLKNGLSSCHSAKPTATLLDVFDASIIFPACRETQPSSTNITVTGKIFHKRWWRILSLAWA